MLVKDWPNRKEIKRLIKDGPLTYAGEDVKYGEQSSIDGGNADMYNDSENQYGCI